MKYAPAVAAQLDDRFCEIGSGFNIPKVIDELTASDDYVFYNDEIYIYDTEQDKYKIDYYFNDRVWKLLQTHATRQRVKAVRTAFIEMLKSEHKAKMIIL